MGGRLDATNICRPVVTAITPVAFDHQQFLGNTLRAIAEEKAGIVKPEVPVVVAPQHDEAVDAIVARCEALNAPLIRTSEPFGVEASDSEDLLRIGSFGFRHRTARGEYDARLNLRGRHQVTNALVAVHVAEELMGAGFDISQPAVVEGLGRVDWPGRLEMIRSSDAEATLLLDGAHNPAGARALREFIDEHFSGVPITLIFGAMADKAVVEMAAILFPAARRIILAGIANPRAAEPEAIAEETGCDAACVESAGEALEEALRITPPEGLIVVCGSLFLVGEVRRLLVGPSREF
jgi:dihydrofolate synthase/folylpolyglutamate synthase